ncbi:MAG: hypothetical protein ACK8QZ_02985 [Anaerolineales bacterium]
MEPAKVFAVRFALFLELARMPPLSFRSPFNSLPASIFSLALVGAAWLVFAWTRPQEGASSSRADESESAVALICSPGATLSRLGEFANKDNLKTIKRLSGVETLRILSDSGPKDLSFEPNRLNVQIDSTNRITGAFCG